MSTLNFQSTKVTVIGMGYVGLPLAIEFGKKWQTVGFDIDETRIKELNDRNDITGEVTAKDFIEAKHIQYTFNTDEIIDSSIYIVTVPTPITPDNLPDLNAIKSATKLISSVISEGDTVIYESTVYPGLTEEICIPILENDNFKINKDFYCGYSPERINPGDKSHRLKDITKVISGSNEYALNLIDDLYSSIIDAGVYRAQSIKVAEAAKVIENTQRDLNIALVNELSIIFKKLDIDTQSVLNAASTKWNFNRFNPGLVGGHCIGVDPYYLTYKSEKAGYTPQIILGGRKLNNEMPAYVADQLIEYLSKFENAGRDCKVLILGCTFKENCPDIRNTKIIDLYEELLERNLIPEIHDPHADFSQVKKEYGVSLTNSPMKNSYHAVILAVPHLDFVEQEHKFPKSFCMNGGIFFDLKGVFKIDESDFRL
jgi:UDP-N-acetyl-D-glucosamine/UDP-N-acetyl-D-galactosamine dehydrogenase